MKIKTLYADDEKMIGQFILTINDFSASIDSDMVQVTIMYIANLYCEQEELSRFNDNCSLLESVYRKITLNS